MPRLIVLCSVLALPVVGWAGQKTYQTGKLVDATSQVYSRETPDNVSVRMHENDLSVQVGDIVYVGQCEEKPHFSLCKPANWIVGDPIEVRFEKDSMYLKTEKGEVKTRVVKRVKAN
ncbi:MAG: hypothetical protein ABSG84_00125 [Acidobacteriaceae bacterium]|jgi:ribosomal protein S17